MLLRADGSLHFCCGAANGLLWPKTPFASIAPVILTQAENAIRQLIITDYESSGVLIGCVEVKKWIVQSAILLKPSA